jgi:aryl-alcohol dehydrogenase-like predicted oxidoreductase
MEYRQLGNAGVRVSVVGLGANRFGSPDVPQVEVDKIIGAALDSGVNFIDTANVYNDGRSEETLGHALKGHLDKVVIATKFNFPRKTGANNWGASRYQMMQAVEQSLRRLQTDHIDLYYCHRWDDTTPIEETLRGLDDLIRMGKLYYIGASLYASWQLAHANVLAELKGWTRFAVLQSEYNMLKRGVEREVLPYCRSGESVRNVQELMTEKNYHRVGKLTAWAKDHGRGVNELAQAWLLAQPSVCSVITGAKRQEHLTSNVKAADWTLSANDLKEIEAILKG